MTQGWAHDIRWYNQSDTETSMRVWGKKKTNPPSTRLRQGRCRCRDADSHFATILSLKMKNSWRTENVRDEERLGLELPDQTFSGFFYVR